MADRRIFLNHDGASFNGANTTQRIEVFRSEDPTVKLDGLWQIRVTCAEHFDGERSVILEGGYKDVKHAVRALHCKIDPFAHVVPLVPGVVVTGIILWVLGSLLSRG